MTDSTAPGLPAQYVRTISEKYATCESYYDEGTVEHLWAIDGSSGSQSSLFRTCFVRPEQFSFEWIEASNDASEERPVNAVLFNDRKARLYTNGVFREFESLQEVIYECDWDIASSCGLVASLLMNLPLLNDTRLAELRNLESVNLNYPGLDALSGQTMFYQGLLIVFDKRFVVRSARHSFNVPASATRALMAGLQKLANDLSGPDQQPRKTKFDDVARAAIDAEGTIRQEFHVVAMNTGDSGKAWHPYSSSVDQWRKNGLR